MFASESSNFPNLAWICDEEPPSSAIASGQERPPSLPGMLIRLASSVIEMPGPWVIAITTSPPRVMPTAERAATFSLSLGILPPIASLGPT